MNIEDRKLIEKLAAARAITITGCNFKSGIAESRLAIELVRLLQTQAENTAGLLHSIGGQALVFEADGTNNLEGAE